MHRHRMSRWSTGLADAWQYGYTDFGEGHGRSPRPVLWAVIGVAAPGAPSRFAAKIDTGGPITVVAAELLGVGGDPVERAETMMLRLGGSTNEAPLSDRERLKSEASNRSRLGIAPTQDQPAPVKPPSLVLLGMDEVADVSGDAVIALRAPEAHSARLNGDVLRRRCSRLLSDNKAGRG